MVAVALPETVTPDSPNTRVRSPGATREPLTVTESLPARSVVLLIVLLSPALPLLVYAFCAAVCAYDHPAGSWLAPAQALASAAACTCRFCKYQPPTSTTNPATPSNATMKNITIGNV